MNKGKTIFGILLGLTALGGAYYLYRRFTKGKMKQEDLAGIPSTTTTTSSSSPSAPRNDKFPIAKGSRGDLVTRLQNALIKAYGASVLPKFGADGIWGNETENALKSKNEPTVFTSIAQIQVIESKGLSPYVVPPSSPTTVVTTGGTFGTPPPSTGIRTII